MIQIDKRTKFGSKLFEQLVYNKYFIDAESHIQHDTIFEAATSTNIPDIPLEDDPDDPYDIQDNNLWYMHNDF
jgi:hypothetical protein